MEKSGHIDSRECDGHEEDDSQCERDSYNHEEDNSQYERDSCGHEENGGQRKRESGGHGNHPGIESGCGRQKEELAMENANHYHSRDSHQHKENAHSENPDGIDSDVFRRGDIMVNIDRSGSSRSRDNHTTKSANVCSLYNYSVLTTCSVITTKS